MSCSIPAQNVKVFGRALHCLAKIGDDLFLEPQVDGLAVRAINSSRSAFVSFLFSPDFFTSYSRLPPNKEAREEDVKSKLPMKSAVSVFKSISSLDRTVESAAIEVDPSRDQVLFRLRCKFGVTKTFKLHVLESESLAVNVDPSRSGRHRFSCSARTLGEAANNFLTSQEEVTMSARARVFRLRNYVDQLEEEQRAAVHTVLSMQPGEFETYSIEAEEEEEAEAGSDLTYCLKELRAMISFADAFNLSLTASFDEGGSPIVFSLKWPHTCEAALVMATMAEESPAPSSSQQRRGEKSKRIDRPRRQSQDRSSARLVAEEDSEEMQPPPPQHSLPLAGDPRVSTQASGALRLGQQQASSPAITPINTPGLLGEDDGGEDQVECSRLADVGANGDGPQGAAAAPPSKRAKFLFRKCFDATFNPRTGVTGSDRILAPDSDEEKDGEGAT